MFCDISIIWETILNSRNNKKKRNNRKQATPAYPIKNILYYVILNNISSKILSLYFLWWKWLKGAIIVFVLLFKKCDIAIEDSCDAAAYWL